MNFNVFEQGKTLCEQGKAADRMFLIDSGIVKVVTKFDKRRQDEFVIERLTRGAIINAKSFLIKDDVDTAFVCETTVKCYTLLSETVDAIEKKRAFINIFDLQRAKKKVDQELSIPVNDIALDYIIHNSSKDSYKNFETMKNAHALKVKLKNAVMQEWTQVSNKRKSKSIKDLVEEMCAAKEKKKKKESEKPDENQQVVQKMHNPEAYLSKEQFTFLQKKIK